MIEVRNLGVNIFSADQATYNNGWAPVSDGDRAEYLHEYTFNGTTYDVIEVKEHYQSFNSLIRIRNLVLAILATVLSIGGALAHPVIRQWFTGRQVVVILQARNHPPLQPNVQPGGFSEEKRTLIDDLQSGRLDLSEGYHPSRRRLNPFRGDRDVALAAVSQNGNALAGFDDTIKDDEEVVLAAVNQTGEALGHASDRLKNNRGVVLAAVRQDGLALYFSGGDPVFGTRFNDDEEVVLAAVNQNGEARRYASLRLQNQENVKDAAREQLRAAKIARIRECSGDRIDVFNLINDELFKDDEQVVLEIVRRWPWAIQHAGPSCRSNRAIALEVVALSGLALQYFTDDLKNDPDVVLAAVQQNGLAIRYANVRFRSHEATMLAAVQQNGLALEYADNQLKKNENIVLAAVQQNGLALQYADDELKKNEVIVLAAVQQNGLALEHADDELKKNEVIVFAAVRENGSALEFANEALQNREDIVLEAVRRDLLNGNAFRHANSNLRGKKELVLRIIREERKSILEHVSEELRGDKEVALAGVEAFGWGQLEYVDEKLLRDKDVLLTAFCSCKQRYQDNFNFYYIREKGILVGPGETKKFASLQEFIDYFISTGEIEAAPHLGEGRYALVSPAGV